MWQNCLNGLLCLQAAERARAPFPCNDSRKDCWNGCFWSQTWSEQLMLCYCFICRLFQDKGFAISPVCLDPVKSIHRAAFPIWIMPLATSGALVVLENNLIHNWWHSSVELKSTWKCHDGFGSSAMGQQESGLSTGFSHLMAVWGKVIQRKWKISACCRAQESFWPWARDERVIENAQQIHEIQHGQPDSRWELVVVGQRRSQSAAHQPQRTLHSCLAAGRKGCCPNPASFRSQVVLALLPSSLLDLIKSFCSSKAKECCIWCNSTFSLLAETAKWKMSKSSFGLFYRKAWLQRDVAMTLLLA